MRKGKMFVMIFFLLVFALFGILAKTGRFEETNRAFNAWVHGLETPALTKVLKSVTHLGEWFAYVPCALALLCIPKLRRSYGLPAAATLAVSAPLNALLKRCFAIARPDTHRLIVGTGFGFPSGHAMNGAAFVGVCTLLFVRRTSSKACRVCAPILAGTFIVVVGFSRVYLGVHNISDIVAGYAMGFFVCFAVAGGAEMFASVANTRENA